jgi:hypothetical protein
MERRVKIAITVLSGVALAALLTSGGGGEAVSDTSGSNGLSGPTAALRRRILEIAYAELRRPVREDSAVATRNRGERIDEYNRYAGPGLGAAYCASFVTWVVGQAYGRDRRLPWMNGSTSGIMVPARNAYREGKLPAEYVAFHRDPSTWHRVRPGWVFVKGTTSSGSDPLEASVGGWDTGHTGIITKPISSAAGYYESIDGNTKGKGATVGGVYATLRPWSNPSDVIFFDPVAVTMALGQG